MNLGVLLISAASALLTSLAFAWFFHRRAIRSRDRIRPDCTRGRHPGFDIRTNSGLDNETLVYRWQIAAVCIACGGLLASDEEAVRAEDMMKDPVPLRIQQAGIAMSVAIKTGQVKIRALEKLAQYHP